MLYRFDNSNDIDSDNTNYMLHSWYTQNGCWRFLLSTIYLYVFLLLLGFYLIGVISTSPLGGVPDVMSNICYLFLWLPLISWRDLYYCLMYYPIFKAIFVIFLYALVKISKLDNWLMRICFNDFGYS